MWEIGNNGSKSIKKNFFFIVKEQRVNGSQQDTFVSCLRCILYREEISLGLSLSSLNNLKRLSPVISYSKPHKGFYYGYNILLI